MLNITARNVSSVISDHLIQFLTEPSLFNVKIELQRCFKNFDKAKSKNDL